jgi:hypothetical protein
MGQRHSSSLRILTSYNLDVNFYVEISPINEFNERKNDKSPAAPHTLLLLNHVLKGMPITRRSIGNTAILLNHSRKMELFPSHYNGAYLDTEVCFIICNNSFWCASLLNPKRSHYKCPECRQPNIESMLIVEDEDYKSPPILTHEEEEMVFSG